MWLVLSPEKSFPHSLSFNARSLFPEFVKIAGGEKRYIESGKEEPGLERPYNFGEKRAHWPLYLQIKSPFSESPCARAPPNREKELGPKKPRNYAGVRVRGPLNLFVQIHFSESFPARDFL